jgi:sulfotransferase
MKKNHFISGLPRSGSTLLSTIQNQNPDFNADISSPLARFVRAIITESHAGPGYHLQCDEQRRIKLIQGLVENYYYDTDASVCFNTNRGWTALVDALAISHPDSKVICCVRDINWILDSFETLFRKNPFSISKMYSPEEATTVHTRCDALMSPGHTLKFAGDSLHEAITGPNANKIFLVEYEQLAKSPEKVMKALYNFISEPYFSHDFTLVEASYDEFDADANINGLHKIRKGVSFVSRESILPKNIWEKYSNQEFWR